jgi:hypothetical protein
MCNMQGREYGGLENRYVPMGENRAYPGEKLVTCAKCKKDGMMNSRSSSSRKGKRGSSE